MGEPTHAFVPWKPGDTEFCRVRIQNETGSAWECGEPRSAHPASPPATFYQKLAASQEDLPPEAAKVLYENLDKLYDASPPEPAPESEEPSHDPPYDASGRIVAKSGGPDPAPEPLRPEPADVATEIDEWATDVLRASPHPEPEPCQLPPHLEPEKLRRMAEEWLAQHIDEYTFEAPGQLARLLERVVWDVESERDSLRAAVRWALGESDEPFEPPMLPSFPAYWWRKRLRELAGLAPSPESPKEGK